MHRDIQMYLDDICEIESMFEAVDLKEAELDTDAIEDILTDWEQFIGNLRDAGDHALANQVYEKIEEIEELLAKYEDELIQAEEQAAIDEAGNRLSQSAVENLAHYSIQNRNKPVDIGREHKAEFRLSDKSKDFPERLKRLDDNI